MDPSQNHHSTAMSQHQPQDVLAEARKNLQVLIDSGLSKDLLHQWVDDSQSLQLQLAALPQLQQSLASPVASPQQVQQHQQHQQHPTSYIPPHPQGPPPPPPTIASSAASTTSTVSTSPTVTTPTAADIKTETVHEDAVASWPSTPSSASILRTMSIGDADAANAAAAAAAFMAPSAAAAASFSHRPRISVSSTSSGSSGHASIWSTNSAQSGMSGLSWQSASTAASRCHAPLPMPPVANGGHSPTNGTFPMIAGAPMAAATASGNGNKLNIYWCTSCETSFKRKYDWKRHEDEFHERWRKYPCPEPGCNRSFWGSNSFNQHHKQCHGCKTCPHAEKVVKFLRKRKYWACGFCSALHPARERHVEHVARHFESSLTKGDWMHSRVVYGLLHQPLIHEAWDALVNSKHQSQFGRRPQFSWHPSKTGRAQGFLEKENPGQLQDLLEFFSGDEGEAQWIVSVAYNLADIVHTNAPVPSAQFAQDSMGPPSYPSDPRMSFATLPSQAAQPQMLPTPDQSGQNPFAAPFRNTMFVPSQPFSAPSHTSPESASQSPLMTPQSSMANSQSQSPHDKRDLPPPPPSAPNASDGMMEYEFSSAPVDFEDWESLNSVMVDDASIHQVNPSQPTWGLQFFNNDPRIQS